MNKCLEDTSVIRRITFAARSLPKAMPHYWETMSSIGILGKSQYTLTAEETRLFIENVQFLNSDLLMTDAQLQIQLIDTLKPGPRGNAVPGIVLLSLIDKCMLCGHKLYVRSDRGVKAVVYDDILGTIPAIHYTR